MTTYRHMENIIKALYEEVVIYREIIKSAKKVLHPILKILDNNDIPVERISWNRWERLIELPEDIALTKDAMSEIKKLLGDIKISKTIESGGIQWNFGNRYSTKCVHIKNGNNTCKIRKIKRTVSVPAVPAHTREEYSYELEGDCSSADILEQREEENDEEDSI